MGKTKEIKPFQCTYEKIALFKRVPYWLYWGILGLLILLIYQLLIYFLSETDYFVSRLLSTFVFVGLPIGFIWTSRSFRELMEEFSPIAWTDKAEFEKWLNVRLKHNFTLSSRESRGLVIIIFVMAITTSIVSNRVLFQSDSLNAITFLLFILSAIIGGQVIFMVIALLATLTEIVKLPVEVPFFMLPHPAIGKLQGFYSTTAFIMTIAYVFTAVIFWQGPLGISTLAMFWLIILSFVPLSIFFWSSFQIHKLIQKVKYSHLLEINSVVQETLAEVKEGGSVEAVDRLTKIINIQTTVQSVKEWSIEFQSVLTFLTASAATIIQIIATIRELSGP